MYIKLRKLNSVFSSIVMKGTNGIENVQPWKKLASFGHMDGVHRPHVSTKRRANNPGRQQVVFNFKAFSIIMGYS
jgi:hypothetical protein